MTDEVTHQEIRDRIDRMEQHNEETHGILFQKMEKVSANFNRWFIWTVGLLVGVLGMLIVSNQQVHTALSQITTANTTRIAILEELEVPPPEVIHRFEVLERDAENRERQLDAHIEQTGHRGRSNE